MKYIRAAFYDQRRREFVLAALLSPFWLKTASAWASTIAGRDFAGFRSPTGAKEQGGEGVRVTSDTILKKCNFRNLGNGAVRVWKNTDKLTIEDCKGNNIYRLLEVTASNKSGQASLTNFTLRRITARNLEHGLTRIRYNSRFGIIENVSAYGRPTCDLFCVGFQLDDHAQAITYERVEAHNFRERTRPSDEYWNGDGFSDERGNRAIRYSNCLATGCSDGGFDLKSKGVVLENCTARANKRNYRLWGDGILRHCRSENPIRYGGTGSPAHFSFHGQARHFVLDRPIVRAAAGNKAPVFLLEAKKRVTLEIRNADIYAPSAPLFKVDGPRPKIIWSPPRSEQRIRVESWGNA